MKMIKILNLLVVVEIIKKKFVMRQTVNIPFMFLAYEPFVASFITMSNHLYMDPAFNGKMSQISNHYLQFCFKCKCPTTFDMCVVLYFHLPININCCSVRNKIHFYEKLLGKSI